MSYTLATAVTEVRHLLNESTASFWTDTQLQGWIQQATTDISCKTLCTTAEGTITLVQNQQKYTSADESWIGDNLKVMVMWYNLGSSTYGMQRTEPYRFGHLQVGGTDRPRYWFEDNRKIYLWPIPGSDENGVDITCIYSKITNDITELREEYQQLTFLYASAMAKARDRKFQEAALYQQMYLNALNFERQDKYTMGSLPTEAFKQP